MLKLRYWKGGLDGWHSLKSCRNKEFASIDELLLYCERRKISPRTHNFKFFVDGVEYAKIG